MRESTAHFADQISIGFGVFGIVMVDYALNIADIFTIVVIVKTKPRFFVDVVKLILVFEDSIVDVCFFQNLIDLKSVFNFFSFAVDNGKMKLFGGLSNKESHNDTSKESIVVNWRISHNEMIDFAQWFRWYLAKKVPKQTHLYYYIIIENI